MGPAQRPGPAGEHGDRRDTGGAPAAPRAGACPIYGGQPRRHRPRPLVGLRSERGYQGGGHGGGQLRTGAAQRPRECGAIAPLGRSRSRQRLERHDGEGIQVGPAVEPLLPGGLFGRHVIGSADRDPGRRQRRGRNAHDVRHPEVGEQRATRVVVDEDVGRLHVAVHDAALVGMVERPADLPCHAQRGVERRPLLRERALQRGPAHERHDEERDPVAHAKIVHRHDVRVSEGCGERGFLLKASPAHFAGRHLERQDLDGDHVPQRHVPRAVDESHPPGAHRAEQLVAIADGALHVFQCGRLHTRAESTGACSVPHCAR